MLDVVVGAALFGGGVIVGALWRGALKTQNSQTAWRPPEGQNSAPFAVPGFGSDSVSPEVRDLARRGRKIEAIKLHREQTGAGLKDAKDAVERDPSA